VPETHVPLTIPVVPQQPPLHSVLGLQEVLHEPEDWQAWPTGQSLATLHALQVPSGAHTSPPHEMQLPPSTPHAEGSTPLWQLFPSQQPPLHSPGPVHAAPHLLAVQARPIGQSAVTMHPHTPPRTQT
jgi:hypothetical protein